MRFNRMYRVITIYRTRPWADWVCWRVQLDRALWLDMSAVESVLLKAGTRLWCCTYTMGRYKSVVIFILIDVVILVSVSALSCSM